jgi:hypothetical protein
MLSNDEILPYALIGYQAQRDAITSRIAQIEREIAERTGPTVQRQRSADTRRRMSEAQKKRCARRREENATQRSRRVKANRTKGVRHGA